MGVESAVGGHRSGYSKPATSGRGRPGQAGANQNRRLLRVRGYIDDLARIAFDRDPRSGDLGGRPICLAFFTGVVARQTRGWRLPTRPSAKSPPT